jgi:hypothetical protein
MSIKMVNRLFGSAVGENDRQPELLSLIAVVQISLVGLAGPFPRGAPDIFIEVA